MTRTLAKVPCKYGAPMGRPSDLTLSGKVRLSHVRLDNGGYDSGGAYWGLGEPLWWAEDSEGNERFFRAPDRNAAKTRLPGCRFYR